LVEMGRDVFVFQLCMCILNYLGLRVIKSAKPKANYKEKAKTLDRETALRRTTPHDQQMM
jgi:hypothetical protein